MKKNTPSRHASLMLQIMHLKAEKFEQETQLIRQVHVLAEELKPVSVLKKSLHDITTDSEIQTELLKAGMGLTSKYLISRIFKKQESVKGFLSAVILEKISGIAISKNAASIMERVGELFHPRNKNQNNQ